MATQVTITTTKKNLTAQKMRAAISMALACSKDNDYDGLRIALKQLDDASVEFKSAVI